MANKKDLNILVRKARTLVIEAGQILLEEKEQRKLTTDDDKKTEEEQKGKQKYDFSNQKFQ